MKRIATIPLLLALLALLWTGCKNEKIDREMLGNISGQVQNSTTGEGVAFASITTNPGTDAILTDDSGNFAINQIPEGNYSVQASKEDFETKQVRVSVNENRTANAQILLESDNQPSSEFINADVTGFLSTSRNDSMFVEVDYRVQNTSSNTTASSYEVYFQIFTSERSFFEEVQGDSLFAGEQDTDSFTRYIRQFSADSVVVTGVFAPDDD